MSTLREAARFPPGEQQAAPTSDQRGGRFGTAGARASIRVVQGGAKEAQALFQQLSRGGEVIKGSSFPGTLVRLPSGGTVGLRTMATGTGSRATPSATIELSKVPGVAIDKIKFVP